MKLVITGALGHIGSRLIQGIRPGDFSEVLLLDNLLTQRYASLFRLPEGVPFRFVEEDILASDLESRFAGAYAVVHLAAITDAASSFGREEAVEKVNLEGTERVARACLATGSRLLFPSTTSVYGTQGETVDEDCPESDLKPQSPYALSKLKAENLLKDLGREGLRFIACRFGTIFGASPGMRFHTAVNKFIWQACLGEPVTVWRTALHQKRPYLDLEDAAAVVFEILRRDFFDNGIYNVLTLNATVEEIVEAIRRHVPDLAVRLTDSRIMNQLSYDVSGVKLSRAGFECRGSLDRGVQDTVALLRNGRPWP